MDDYKNLTLGRVLVAPNPVTTGTSLELLLGQGQRFPAVPFNATVWPVTEFPQPTVAEIVRVTARSGDVFTIVRGQEGTVAQAIGAGWAFASSITKLMIDALRNADNINAGTLDNARLSSDVVLRSQVPEAWPVFSIFMTTTPVNPNALLGYGTWMAFGQGRVLVGLDNAQTEFNASEKVGGEKTHATTIAEMPAHNHGGTTAGGSTVASATAGGATAAGSTVAANTSGGTTVAAATAAGTSGQDSPDHAHGVYDPTHAHNFPTNSTGGGVIGAEEGFTGGARATFAASTGIAVLGATVRHQHGIPALGIPALNVNPLGIPALTVNPFGIPALGIPALTVNPLAIPVQGGSTPHNNLQPYITVYMWKRTA